MVTWKSVGDVYQRRYTAGGSTSGPDAVVPAWLGSTENSYPQIATLPDGRWVVVWENRHQDEYPGAGIARRVFTPVAIDSVTSAAEYATGTNGGETLEVEEGGLSLGDILDGGDGVDALQMTWTGSHRLSASHRTHQLRGSGRNRRKRPHRRKSNAAHPVRNDRWRRWQQ